jgi:hypothetical protein
MSVRVEIVEGGLSLKQEYGCYTSATATMRVSALTSSTPLEGVAEALAACPAYGSFLSISSNLILSEKEAKLVSFTSTGKVVDVTLTYIAYSELADKWVWKCGTNLKQINTNKDVLGIPLSAAYTYPDSTSPDGEYVLRPELAGQTVTAGASVSTDYGTAVLRGQGIMDSDSALIYPDMWMGKVNSEPWGGIAAGKCRVEEVVPKTIDYSTSPRKVLVSVAIQIDAAGFDKPYAFKDPNTGEPPADIVPGTGLKLAVVNQTMDYNTIWPVS